MPPISAGVHAKASALSLFRSLPVG